MLNREEGKRENFKRKRRKEVRKNKGRQKERKKQCWQRGSTKHFTDFRKSKQQALPLEVLK
jgi:hypothetical protein